MSQQGGNLRETLLLAHTIMDRCEAYLGESNDDSGRAIYANIGAIMEQHGPLLTQASGHQNGARLEGKAA